MKRYALVVLLGCLLTLSLSVVTQAQVIRRSGSGLSTGWEGPSFCPTDSAHSWLGSLAHPWYGGFTEYIYDPTGTHYIHLSSSGLSFSTIPTMTLTAGIIGTATITTGNITTGNILNGNVGILKAAKDTTVEVASFGRTLIADTAAIITGVDSLTAAYIITPLATRNVITAPPSVAGVAATSVLLIIRRPAADTAAYDRYSIVKIGRR